MNFSDPYRDATAERHYVCPGCSTAQRGPAQGGQVACPQCRAPFALPDRSALLASAAQVPMPYDDPGRIQQLRVQDGRPRVAAPTLEAVLGGQGVQPGREQEAVMIWQSLRMRASQGDVAASEDLATLTLLLSQLPMVEQQPMMTEALSESTFDAGVLPRHKMEQLGRLARRAAAAGDRARAERYLSWMSPSAPELDADSEFRVSSAVVATLARDGQRVLALLGPQKDAIPMSSTRWTRWRPSSAPTRTSSWATRRRPPRSCASCRIPGRSTSCAGASRAFSCAPSRPRPTRRSRRSRRRRARPRAPGASGSSSAGSSAPSACSWPSSRGHHKASRRGTSPTAASSSTAASAS